MAELEPVVVEVQSALMANDGRGQDAVVVERAGLADPEYRALGLAQDSARVARVEVDVGHAPHALVVADTDVDADHAVAKRDGRWHHCVAAGPRLRAVRAPDETLLHPPHDGRSESGRPNVS